MDESGLRDHEKKCKGQPASLQNDTASTLEMIDDESDHYYFGEHNVEHDSEPQHYVETINNEDNVVVIESPKKETPDISQRENHAASEFVDFGETIKGEIEEIEQCDPLELSNEMSPSKVNNASHSYLDIHYVDIETSLTFVDCGEQIKKEIK